MNTLRTLSILMTALAIGLLSGCGGSSSTRTVTTTATTTVTETVTEEATPAETDFCDTNAGDALDQAASDAQAAFNDTDEAAFAKAVDLAIKSAKGGPSGESCVSDSLNAIVESANTGAGNLAGLDLKAIVRRIRKFEDAHDISRKSPYSE